MTSNCTAAANSNRADKGRTITWASDRWPTALKHLKKHACGVQAPLLHFGQCSFWCSEGAGACIFMPWQSGMPAWWVAACLVAGTGLSGWDANEIAGATATLRAATASKNLRNVLRKAMAQSSSNNRAGSMRRARHR
jgi:hypothetical protein